MNEGKWVRFEPGPAKPKTQTWFVVSKEQEEALGEVKWFGRWRRYAFFPFPDTIYEGQCLRDIAAFTEQATREQRGQNIDRVDGL